MWWWCWSSGRRWKLQVYEGEGCCFYVFVGLQVMCFLFLVICYFVIRICIYCVSKDCDEDWWWGLVDTKDGTRGKMLTLCKFEGKLLVVLKVLVTMIIGTSLCRLSIGSFLVTKTITSWSSTMTIINVHLVKNYAPKWSKFDNYVPQWQKFRQFFFLIFFHFYFLGCLSRLSLCKHHHTVLIFGKTIRKKKRRWWCGCVVLLLLDKFPRGANMAFEGSWES